MKTILRALTPALLGFAAIAHSADSRGEFRAVLVPKSMPVVRFLTDAVGASGFLVPTEIAPRASGTVELWNDADGVVAWVQIDGIRDPRTYSESSNAIVLWAVTPTGRATNLGEFEMEGSMGRLQAKTPLRCFGLMVTVEPDFAVPDPGPVVLAKADFPSGLSEGKEVFEADAAGLVREPAVLPVREDALSRDLSIPRELSGARRAVARMKSERGETPEPSQAERDLLAAETHFRDGRRSEAVASARLATQLAEEERTAAIRERAAARERARARDARWKTLSEKLEVARLKDEIGELRDALAESRADAPPAVSVASVYFEPGDFRLNLKMQNRLRRLLRTALGGEDGGTLEVSVSGHADSTGTPDWNFELSERRARAVADFLRTEGVPEDAIVTRALGDFLPVDGNDSPEGRQQNRRVDVEIRRNAK